MPLQETLQFEIWLFPENIDHSLRQWRSDFIPEQSEPRIRAGCPLIHPLRRDPLLQWPLRQAASTLKDPFIELSLILIHSSRQELAPYKFGG